MRPALPDALLSRFSELLATRMGLHFPAERWNDLERGLTAAASAFGMPDAKSCVQRLLSAPLTHHEIEVLASCLTVGETYFFREQQSFDVLAQHILPDLLRVRERAARRLRIWSAGCCTGEEPYSMAMFLDRLIPDAAAWNITLLATDINPAFLRKAAEGEYGEWSFRSTPAWLKARYFQPSKGNRFRLDERIRKRVAFAPLNLADDAYPSLVNNTNAMDIIFCRNVLMYFRAEQARAVIDKLHRSLVDGGWLIVSPAETSSTLFSRFTTVMLDGAILYRKDATAQAPRLASYLPSAPAPAALAGVGDMAAVEAPAKAMPASSTATDDRRGYSYSPLELQRDQMSRAARDCANAGRLEEAAEWCRQAIAVDKLDPAHHYLLSAIQQEQGQGDDAAQSLARTLYLDPDFVLAHYALGNLRQSQGRHGEAQRHFANALSALQTHPSDAILPESDGLTAGRLGEIIETMRSSMPHLAVTP
jgi:chemotaxis protein methyltransferase CheR